MNSKQLYCTLCGLEFSKKSNLTRHVNTKHNQQDVHTCGECGKAFNRKDNLRQHQSICKSIRFKCPRCHRILRDVASLSKRMGLCPVFTCATCQEQFGELNQLREHKVYHTKRKAVSNSESILKKKRRNNREMFYCRVCLQSFMNREEPFHHKLEHMADSTAYHPVEHHFDLEDERVNALLHENADLIFTAHQFTQIGADFNFPRILSLVCDGWIPEMYQALDLVANVNNQESFKINFSMEFILMNRQTGRYHFFVPHENNAFIKKPIRIDRPASWRELYSQLNEESLKAYITHHREDAKWIPVMLTNFMIHLYFLRVPMGQGELPQYIKDNRSIAGLDKDRHHSTPYEDKLCGLRYLAFHLNLKDVGDGYKGLETRTQQLCQEWERTSVDLTEMPLFEEQFNINVDIYSLCEDGTVVPCYLSEELYQAKMVLNLHDTHLSYVTNIPAYLQTYHCDSCGRHFDQLSNWKHHQGGCANATEYEFPGGVYKMTPSIFNRLEEFDIMVP